MSPAFVIYVNRRFVNYTRLTDRCDLPFRYSIHGMYRRRAASTGPAGLEKLAPSKRRTRAKMHAGRQAGRQTRVRFIPDDVHVVVIIIIAFCIITIISAATSVIYSRSRACIMRAGALRLQALITTLPLFIHRYSGKDHADDRNRSRRRGRRGRRRCIPHVTRSETAQEVSPRIA